MASARNTFRSWRSALLLLIAFLLGAAIMAAIGFLLTNIAERKSEAREYPLRIVEISPDELDPAVWGVNFPREYATFRLTENFTASTPYGGSVPYNKLERYPALLRLWAGNPFSVDY